MIERTTGSIIILADHSKWGVVSNFQVSTIDEIDVLITDEAFDKSAFKSLKEHAVKIIIAKAK